MVKNNLPSGVVHKLPADLYQVLISQDKIKKTWKDITPLARNEWICWIENAKKEETRKRRITIMLSKFKNGERRPCCFAGCTHR